MQKKKRKEIKVCKGIAEHLGIAVQAEIVAGKGIALPVGIAVCLKYSHVNIAVCVNGAYKDFGEGANPFVYWNCHACGNCCPCENCDA